MVTEALKKRLDTALKDIAFMSNTQRVLASQNDRQFIQAFQTARDLSIKWLEVAKSLLKVTDDATISPLVSFVEKLGDLVNSGQPDQNETFAATLLKRTDILRKDLVPLRVALLENIGLTTKDTEDLNRQKDIVREAVDAAAANATDTIKATLREAEDGIRQKAADAVAEFEAAKAKSQKISIGDAQTEFSKAALSLKAKTSLCFTLTGAFFLALICLLLWYTFRPPRLIGAIVDAMMGSKQTLQPVPIPLLIAASAYFTSIRLAFIAVLSVGLAFSLKLTRAYLHMVEHNEHKARVTNSIEGFVASVRTDEQKDLVLGKLVDSVTQFGDSGILEKEKAGQTKMTLKQSGLSPRSMLTPNKG